MSATVVLAGALALAGVAGFGLAVGTVTGTRPPPAPVPDRAGYLRGWSELHGGHAPEPSTLTTGWLSLGYRLARPLAARGVPPTALTGWGLLAAVAVPVVAVPGGRWPVLAAVVTVLSAVLDTLDGAVAVLTGRATRFGAVLDSLADRLADVAYAVALWPLGAPGWLCAAAAGTMLLHEYTRARATAVGMAGIGMVTVWERPTRIILTTFLLLGAGTLTHHASTVATAGAAAWVGLGALGLAQLLPTIHRHLGHLG